MFKTRGEVCKGAAPCTLDTIISRRSDCIVLGDFNCPKVNWASNTAPPNTVDSQLLNFHQCALTPTRFHVNQHPSLLDLILVKFPQSREQSNATVKSGQPGRIQRVVHVAPPISVSTTSSADLGESYELNAVHSNGILQTQLRLLQKKNCPS